MLKENEEATTIDEKKASEKTTAKTETNAEAERNEDDSIRWRAKYKITKEELETIKAKAENEKLELFSKVETTTKERKVFEEKYIDAELKAHAVSAGIKDIDLVKLIDKADVKLDENGNITGIEKAITDFKAKKPDWFGSEKKVSTSTNATFAEKETKTALDARTMSKEDWKAKKSRFMAGQF